MRLAALVLNRGESPDGCCIAAERVRLHGKEIINYSLDVLRNFGDTVVVTPTANASLEDQVLSTLRMLSSSSMGAPDFVLLHDSTRALISRESVEAVISLLQQDREIVTTCIQTREPQWFLGAIIKNTFSLQTPEGFPFNLLLRAHEWRAQIGRTFGSGTELVGAWLGITPTFVPLGFSNSRVETQEDMAAVEGILKFGQRVLKEDPRDLAGLHVLVLGGSGGIGRACLEFLEELGATYHAPSRLDLDLRRKQDYPNLASYQAVIHAAGEYEASPEDIMKVNFFSCLDLLSSAKREKFQGNIVFISSAASTWGRQGIPVYSASKSALNALVESEAERLAAKGIMVNVVAPGKVSTRLQSVINPSLSVEAMLSPRYVARIIVRYLRTYQYGKLVFLRKGFDVE